VSHRLRCSGRGRRRCDVQRLGYMMRFPIPCPVRRGPERLARRVGGGEAAVRPYEVMVIFDVGLEDGDINAGIDRITSLVRDRG